MAVATMQLEVKDTQGTRRFPFSGSAITIGRNITNIVVLDEPLSSRFHCVIEKTPDGFRARDLDSRNGTKVNGQPIKTTTFATGDVMKIGATELRLVGSAVSAAAKPVARPAPVVSSFTPQAPTHEWEAAEALEGFADPIMPEEMEEFEPTVAAPLVEATNDWERILLDRAESLPNKQFGLQDISLYSSRGQVAHAAKPGSDKQVSKFDSVLVWRLILITCFRSRATDIHIEPKQENVNVRVRVDGVMVDVVHLPKDMGTKVLSLIKVISDIDISQRNIVQEGSFSSRVPGKGSNGVRRVDYRVSFAPAMFGQKLVIRILDSANAPLHIDDLNLPTIVADQIRKTIKQESGMILVAGPTGSGKTTTLYAVVRDIDVTESNVVTIEDPVEIQIEGVTQIPVNDAQGNTFAALLRSVLRQDPDAILVGEIRDAETARIGMQASMTGHLVFSTVHSRDTVGALYRLLDLGVEPYLVSSGLHLVLAQRLVRQLCRHCREAVAPTPQQKAVLEQYKFHNVTQIYEGRGCKRCLDTGYFGRRNVIELLSFNSRLREVLLKSPTVDEIQKTLDPENYVRLGDTGYKLVAEGISSFEEVERAVS